VDLDVDLDVDVDVDVDLVYISTSCRSADNITDNIMIKLPIVVVDVMAVVCNRSVGLHIYICKWLLLL
jgi:hypothetical protein